MAICGREITEFRPSHPQRRAKLTVVAQAAGRSGRWPRALRVGMDAGVAMISAWLPALGLALVLVVGAAVLLLRRRRGAKVAPPPARLPAQTPAAQRPAAPVAAPAAAPAGAPVTAGAVVTADAIDARRQAATDALRLARQRKADEAAQLEAERAARARAAARAASAPQVAPPPAPAPQMAPPPAPAAPRAPAGWSSRPMDLGPAEPAQPPPPRPRPVAVAPMAAPAAMPAASAVPAAPAAPAARPLASVHPLPVPRAAPPGAPLAPVVAVVPVATPAAHVPVVLVADDSKVVRVKTGRLLEKQGWQVLLAEDGAAALALLDSQTPDLLITDVEMPGVDGFTLTRQVRGHARCARLPVIMITSSDERHRAEAQAAGVDLLLGKPYAEELLLAQAQRLLGAAPPVLH